MLPPSLSKPSVIVVTPATWSLLEASSAHRLLSAMLSPPARAAKGRLEKDWGLTPLP